MKHLFVSLFVLIMLLLAACGGAAPEASELTAEAVVQSFQDAGIELTNINNPERDPESPLPNSYDTHTEFDIVALGDDGGQVFVCSTQQNCDAIYAYFDALAALAGPYLYQSEDGTVVAQLNSGLTPEQAAAFEEVIEGL